MNPELVTWCDRIEAVIAASPSRVFDRVRVLAETESTQDAAWDAAGDRPGLVVLAGRQTRGRGRLGRAWVDDEGLGVAMSVVVRAPGADELLSLRAGLAVCRAGEALLGVPLGLRWPNDVVEPAPGARKLAGVLVEARGPLAVVGIGLNVLQRARNWHGPLVGNAVALAELGAETTRIDAACALLASLERALLDPPAEVIAGWRERDRLIGSECALFVGPRRVVGRVLDIDPAGELSLLTGEGTVMHLPAALVSIDHAFGLER